MDSLISTCFNANAKMRKNFTVVIVQIGPILKNLMLMIISFSFDIGAKENCVEIRLKFKSILHSSV